MQGATRDKMSLVRSMCTGVVQGESSNVRLLQRQSDHVVEGASQEPVFRSCGSDRRASAIAGAPHTASQTVPCKRGRWAQACVSPHALRVDSARVPGERLCQWRRWVTT